MCGHYLNTLLKLLSKEHNPHADKFIRVVCTIPVHKMKDLEIGTHIESARIRNCRLLCFEFLKIYLQENPKFNSSMIIKSLIAIKTFTTWQNQMAKGPGLITAYPPLSLEKKDAEQIQAIYQPTSTKVFGQSCSEAETYQKQVNFIQKAKDEFEATKNFSVATQTLQAKVDVVNHDMAFIRLTIPMPLDKQFGRYSGLDIIRMKRSQIGGESFLSLSAKGEEQLFRSIFPSKCLNGGFLYAEGRYQACLSKQGALEVQIKDGEKVLVLNLILEECNFFQQSGSLFNMSFSSASRPKPLIKLDKSSEKHRELIEPSERDNGSLLPMNELCVSYCSTREESTAPVRDLEGGIVIEGLHGSLAFTIRGGSLTAFPKSAELIFDILISSRDKPSQDLIERTEVMGPNFLKFLSGLFGRLAAT